MVNKPMLYNISKIGMFREPCIVKFYIRCLDKIDRRYKISKIPLQYSDFPCKFHVKKITKNSSMTVR